MNIKTFRKIKRLKLKEAAELFGCSSPSLSQIEQNKRPAGLLLAVRIQRVTGGLVQAVELRPDLAELLAGV